MAFFPSDFSTRSGRPASSTNVFTRGCCWVNIQHTSTYTNIIQYSRISYNVKKYHINSYNIIFSVSWLKSSSQTWNWSAKGDAPLKGGFGPWARLGLLPKDAKTLAPSYPFWTGWCCQSLSASPALSTCADTTAENWLTSAIKQFSLAHDPSSAICRLTWCKHIQDLKNHKGQDSIQK